MMPNIDPRRMRDLMSKMGIKSSELNATRVVIELPDREILIEMPQVMRIEAQGGVSFQISGIVTEMDRNAPLEVTEDDIKLVMESTGVKDKEIVKKALDKAKGNIAEAILELTKEQENND